MALHKIYWVNNQGEYFYKIINDEIHWLHKTIEIPDCGETISYNNNDPKYPHKEYVFLGADIGDVSFEYNITGLPNRFISKL